MQRSSERILTTHVGSLARPHELLEVMREKEHGRPYDPAGFTEMVTEAVRDVVRRQAEAGLDVVTDGEQGKVSFLTYVKERLAGFDDLVAGASDEFEIDFDDIPEPASEEKTVAIKPEARPAPAATSTTRPAARSAGRWTTPARPRWTPRWPPRPRRCPAGGTPRWSAGPR